MVNKRSLRLRMPCVDIFMGKCGGVDGFFRCLNGIHFVGVEEGGTVG